jgi:hypothetical protein
MTAESEYSQSTVRLQSEHSQTSQSTVRLQCSLAGGVTGGQLHVSPELPAANE